MDTSGTYIFPDSDKRLLTDSDILNMSREKLRIGRNEIYARHGRAFSSDDLQRYFYTQPWYQATIGSDEFDESSLNEIEKTNVVFLKHAEEGSTQESEPGKAGTYRYEFTACSTGERIVEECTDMIEITDAASGTLTGIYYGSMGCEWSELPEVPLTFTINSHRSYDCDHVFAYPVSLTILDDMLYLYEDGADGIWVFAKQTEAQS